MYWINDGSIERANLDGSGHEMLVTGDGAPINLLLDASVTTAVEEEVPEDGPDFRISPVFPNPYRDRTEFSVLVDESQYVRVSIFNALGQQLRLLHSGLLQAGVTHRFVIDSDGLTPGLYFYQITGERFQAYKTGLRVR